MAAATCSLTVAGETSSYGACQSVAGVGSNFMLYWTLEADPTDASTNVLSMGMSGAAADREYIAVGFSQAPGQMVGASSMILSACTACPGGASIQDYDLDGKIPSSVVPANSLQATATAASFAGGTLAGRFQIKLPASASRRRLLAPALDSPPAAFPLIFAAGPTTAAGAPLQHLTFGSGTFDLTTSELSSTTGTTETTDSTATPPPTATISAGSTNTAARNAHMWLMAISFGVIMPLGIVTMRWWPPQGASPVGFKLHRALQALGFAGAAGGLAAGFVAAGGWNDTYSVHRDLGIAIIVLAFVQVLALVWRPSPDDQKLRRPWALGHRWLGRATAILAIANIYYGIIHVANLGTWAWATYTAVLGVIVIAALGGEMTQRRLRREAQEGICRAGSGSRDDIESTKTFDTSSIAA